MESSIWFGPIHATQWVCLSALYTAAVGLFALFVFSWRRRDTSLADLGEKRVPDDPDPFELAFLRRGSNELVQVIVFSLVKRGYLSSHSEPGDKTAPMDKEIRWSDPVPSGEPNTLLEREVYAAFEVPKTSRSVLRSELPRSIESLARRLYEPGFLKERLIFDPAKEGARRRLLTGGIGCIALLGAYLMTVGSRNGQGHIGLTAPAMAAGITAVAIMLRRRRHTLRGRTYLRALQEAYGPASPTRASKDADPEAVAVAVCRAVILAAAVSGVDNTGATPDGRFGMESPDTLMPGHVSTADGYPPSHHHGAGF